VVNDGVFLGMFSIQGSAVKRCGYGPKAPGDRPAETVK
jgi:hypothetical protein